MIKAFLFDFMGVTGYSRMAVASDPGSGPTRVLMYEEIVAALRQLRTAGFKLALVSNNDRNYFSMIASDIAKDLEELFDAVVYSSDVGCQKPSPAIYEAALSALGVAANEAHYFDDLARNVDAAVQLGMTATVVTSVDDVLSKLSKLM